MKQQILAIDPDPRGVRSTQSACEDFFELLFHGYDTDLEAAMAGSSIGVAVVDVTVESGLRVCEYLRSRWPDVPTIAVSASAALDIELAAYRAGVVDFVPKPLVPELFVQKCRLALNPLFPSLSSNPRILAVDDNRFDRELIREVLGDEYEVFCAATGSEALWLCLQERPDLVLLDVILPDQSGIEVCRAIRASPSMDAVPVVFVSHRTMVCAQLEGLRAGGTDYIPKPIAVPVLRRRLRCLLRGPAGVYG
ncbi:MAG: response regulator [Aquisalimonadaceae bacterium]